MRTSATLGLTAIVAALLLASLLSTASARNLSISELNIRTIWSSLEFQSALVTVRCPVTLEGSFRSRTIVKTTGLLVSLITRVPIKRESCSNGQAEANSLPWRVFYGSFVGTLPNMTRVNWIFQSIRLEVTSLGTTCRYGTETDRITAAASLNAAKEVTTLQPVAGSNTLNIVEGGAFCATSGNLAAAATDGTTTVLNSSTAVRITLI